MSSVHRYSLFGLVIESEVELPELLPVETGGAADVRITHGAIDAGGAALGYHERTDGILFAVPGTALFLIASGSSIILDAASGSNDADVRLFLLGSAFGALLHQRGELPLHANAIELEGQAIAFMGESGAGKSTLAGWFHDRGFTVLADDVCVVRFDSAGKASVFAGLPRLRLWEDALFALGKSGAGLNRSYAGGDQRRKFDFPVGTRDVAAGPVRLGAIYVLDRGDRLSFESLQGVAATDAIFANTYRGAVAGVGERARAHWDAAIALVREVPVFRLFRPWDSSRLNEIGEQIVVHARQNMVKR